MIEGNISLKKRTVDVQKNSPTTKDEVKKNNTGWQLEEQKSRFSSQLKMKRF